uniref:Uncharacterized protein n=1 Tax=Anguilla anguilla TaxID=7936 RepID=A0A0E9SWG4_ANGAN
MPGRVCKACNGVRRILLHAPLFFSLALSRFKNPSIHTPSCRFALRVPGTQPPHMGTSNTPPHTHTQHLHTRALT